MKYFTHAVQMLGIELRRSTPRNPEQNGRVESSHGPFRTAMAAPGRFGQAAEDKLKSYLAGRWSRKVREAETEAGIVSSSTIGLVRGQ